MLLPSFPMNIEFSTAKDGNSTCKFNSIFLHSSYAPLRESERFVSSISSPFKPEIIFIIEPGLSYCTEYLRKKFPDAKLAVIRLIKELEDYNKAFDYSFNYFQWIHPETFFSSLFEKFGENILAFSLLLCWEPSAKIFQKEIYSIFKSYKETIEKCHSVLRTRSFFEKRWIKNALNISIFSETTGELKKKGTCPVVICASGPSLKTVIPFLKQVKAYIIAVSSALRPLFDAGITPDLVISTDGGYWAKKHLETLTKCETKIVLAVEGNIPLSLLKKSKIIPMVYPDGVESELFKKSGKAYITGLRCGTVSGTALEFARQITTGPVYFAGLDLYVSNGFQHTQNNNLELINSNQDKKIFSKEQRLCSQSFSNQKISLKIYEDWFSNLNDLSKNVYRLIDDPQNKLGSIKDIKCEELTKIKFEGERPVFLFSKISSNLQHIQEYIKKQSSTDKWFENVFTADYLNYLHTNDENVKKNLLNKIKDSNLTFLKHLCKVFTKN